MDKDSVAAGYGVVLVTACSQQQGEAIRFRDSFASRPSAGWSPDGSVRNPHAGLFYLHLARSGDERATVADDY